MQRCGCAFKAAPTWPSVRAGVAGDPGRPPGTAGDRAPGSGCPARYGAVGVPLGRPAGGAARGRPGVRVRPGAAHRVHRMSTKAGGLQPFDGPAAGRRWRPRPLAPLADLGAGPGTDHQRAPKAGGAPLPCARLVAVAGPASWTPACQLMGTTPGEPLLSNEPARRGVRVRRPPPRLSGDPAEDGHRVCPRRRERNHPDGEAFPRVLGTRPKVDVGTAHRQSTHAVGWAGSAA
jgi:hypothetical protein